MCLQLRRLDQYEAGLAAGFADSDHGNISEPGADDQVTPSTSGSSHSQARGKATRKTRGKGTRGEKGAEDRASLHDLISTSQSHVQQADLEVNIFVLFYHYQITNFHSFHI